MHALDESGVETAAKDHRLLHALYDDYSAITRVRCFPERDRNERLAHGLGWVPANMCLTPFGPIAAGNPFGALGDLRLCPDPESEVRIADSRGKDLHLFMAGLFETDGTAWTCCPRALLNSAVKALACRHGLVLRIGFEHEFRFLGRATDGVPSGFTFRALRAFEEVIAELHETLCRAGIAPEMVIPEYGAEQFEVVSRPEAPLAAADKAVLLRELARDVARRFGLTASFSPKTAPDVPGNGVHLHISLTRPDGTPATRMMAGDPTRIDDETGRFVSGLLGVLPEIAAVLAPSPPSYLRLRPQQWSAAYTSFGYRNREAAVRLCPGAPLQEARGEHAANVELRVPDATANPHMVVALAILAGLHGLDTADGTPPLIEREPGSLDPTERERLGLKSMPSDLQSALAAFESGAFVQNNLPSAMVAAYGALKRAELEAVADTPNSEICKLYARIY